MADEPPVLDYSRPGPPQPLGDRIGRVVCVVMAVPVTLAGAALLLAALSGGPKVMTVALVLSAGLLLVAATVLWSGTGLLKFRRR